MFKIMNPKKTVAHPLVYVHGGDSEQCENTTHKTIK